MKPIKITATNEAAIESVLAEVNGRATAHTFTTFSEIDGMAKAAEKRLETLSIPKAMRKSATWLEISGACVTSAYAKKCRTRAATAVQIERRGAEWFLVAVSRTEIYKEGGGPGKLTLTKEQAAHAVAVFSKQFKVAAS